MCIRDRAYGARTAFGVINDIDAAGAALMFTEFISSEGLIRNAAKSVQKLDIFEYERPIGIQIFGNNIESMREATEIATSVNPDIIDINYGCPVKKVTCKGGGAAILQDIPKMVKVGKLELGDFPLKKYGKNRKPRNR